MSLSSRGMGLYRLGRDPPRPKTTTVPLSLESTAPSGTASSPKVFRKASSNCRRPKLPFLLMDNVTTGTLFLCAWLEPSVFKYLSSPEGQPLLQQRLSSQDTVLIEEAS